MQFFLSRSFYILFTLYVSQFISFAMLMVVMPVALRENGADLASVSVIYGAGMLWAAKAVFAPPLDRLARRFGFRAYTFVAIIAHLGLAVSTLLLSWLDPILDTHRMMYVVYGLALCMAVQDNAVDALSVRLIPKSRRMHFGTLQAIGGKLGYLIGGAGGLTLYAHLGWQQAVLILFIPTVLGIPALLAVPDLPSPGQGIRDRGRISRWFRDGDALRWLAQLLLLYAGIMALSFLAGPMLVDRGWDASRIALVKDFLGALCGIAIGVLVLLVLKRRKDISDRAALRLISISQWCLCLLFVAAQQTGSEPLLIVSILGLMGVMGMSQGLIYAMMFRRCDPTRAATDFALQYSVMAIGAMVIGITLTRMATTLDYTGSIAIAMLFPLATLLLSFKSQVPLHVD